VSRKNKTGPLAVGPVIAALRDVRRGANDAPRPIVVDGARTLVPLVAEGLREGGDATLVREGGDLGQAAALVWVGEPDEGRLREAARAKLPIVGLSDGQSLPYVLDTDLVVAAPGRPVPTDQLAARLAARLGESGSALAARLPVLREALVDELIRRFARKNGLIGVAVWMPGVDMPILTINQIRLVLRIALAHGYRIDAQRLPDVLGVVGAGLGFRAIARQLLTLIPFAGWATRGAIAYAGTRAVGEAARRRYEAAGDPVQDVRGS
jgi:uncharacterized protein (DUF697 family)